jgi:hypothetical protein
MRDIALNLGFTAMQVRPVQYFLDVDESGFDITQFSAGMIRHSVDEGSF